MQKLVQRCKTFNQNFKMQKETEKVKNNNFERMQFTCTRELFRAYALFFAAELT